MSTIGKRIRQARIHAGLSQTDISTALGVSRSAVAMWESDHREPDLATLNALASLLGTSPSVLILEQPAASSAPLSVPVLGSIPAGVPVTAVQDILDYEELPSSLKRSGAEYFALRINGESMMPEYHTGDVIILRSQDTCESGQDCAVLVGNDDATFKRVRCSGTGITLQPLNPSFEPLSFSPEEVRDLPVRILGVAIELRRKFF